MKIQFGSKTDKKERKNEKFVSFSAYKHRHRQTEALYLVDHGKVLFYFWNDFENRE